MNDIHHYCRPVVRFHMLATCVTWSIVKKFKKIYTSGELRVIVVYNASGEMTAAPFLLRILILKWSLHS